MMGNENSTVKLPPKLETLINDAKRKFQERFGTRKLNFRESVLILACVATILLFWLLALMNGFRSAFSEKTELQSAIARNTAFLTNGPIVRSRLAEKADELTRGSDISGTDLLSDIGELGVETGVSPESSRPTTTSEGPFDVITVRVTIKNASLENLVYFDERISNDSPSIAVTDARFTPSSNDGNTINATYEITAFLLSDDAAGRATK